VDRLRDIVVCALLTCVSGSASAQLRGHFSLARGTYVAADRSHHVLATFTMKNVSGKPLRVPAEPANLCGGYSVEITAIRPRRELKPKGIAGDCLGPNTVVLSPGETRVEKVDVTMLDYNNFLDTPGDYRIRLVRHLQYADADKEVSIGQSQRFRDEFIVHMKPAK
jgi:hypothetical protein